ncbi:MAG TPA: hypothetical protein VK174_01625, partial [Chitinophagales bacterium]|nr:hypothetical protein [Chitinophagales bacterium]
GGLRYHLFHWCVSLYPCADLVLMLVKGNANVCAGGFETVYNHFLIIKAKATFSKYRILAKEKMLRIKNCRNISSKTGLNQLARFL